MRKTYVVTYDICEASRLRRVYRVMLGYGEHLQYSVFRCELSARELVELRERLDLVIHHHEDQVLFVDIGPSDGKSRHAFRAIGRAYDHEEKRVIVV
ncbi:MAG: CRISPR-associated endonuclease Cas2 [Sandaracinaceae bacterium]|nr:CRISPR-associated endonuclease Cas2 [Sandaracinaceae bacterium]